MTYDDDVTYDRGREWVPYPTYTSSQHPEIEAPESLWAYPPTPPIKPMVWTWRTIPFGVFMGLTILAPIAFGILMAGVMLQPGAHGDSVEGAVDGAAFMVLMGLALVPGVFSWWDDRERGSSWFDRLLTPWVPR